MLIGRRPLLRLTALAGSSLVARSVFGQGAAAGSPDPIVIIGAGLAGLHAAAIIRRAGHAVVVLEARPVAGGRVRTLHSPFDDGLYGEAGPIRIASGHATALRLAQEHGLGLVPFESANGSEVITVGRRTVRVNAIGGSAISRGLRPDERGLSQGALLTRYVGTLPESLADVNPSASSYAAWAAYDQLTWPAWLASRGASPTAITLMTLGGDSRMLSALYVLRQYALLRGSRQFYKIRGGMELLPQAMAASLGDLVRYGAAVVRIDQSADPVRIDYMENDQRKSLSASRVIVTTPLSTLRDIDIRPALSAPKQRAVHDLPYYPAVRILLQARSRFWHRSGLSGYARTDQPAEIWDATYDLEATSGILGATVGGEIGTEMLALSDAAALTRGRQIVEVPFPRIRSEFHAGVTHQWARDPWSKGAFAVFHPGQMTSIMPHISTPEGRIHFGGEHTSSWMGWMEGALQSGERCAREVLT